VDFSKIVFLGLLLLFLLFGCKKKEPENFPSAKNENSYLRNFQLKKNGFKLSSEIAVLDKKKEKIVLEKVTLTLDKEVNLKAKKGIYSTKENSFVLKDSEITTVKKEKLSSAELIYLPDQKKISGKKAIFFYQQQKIKAESFIFDQKNQSFELNKVQAKILIFKK